MSITTSEWDRADRDRCCADWPKPCEYHEGWNDGHAVQDAEGEPAALFGVGDSVVCGAHPDGWLVMTDGCGQRDCQGPHRTLLIGPEVTP
jgi:hypothetical protein